MGSAPQARFDAALERRRRCGRGTPRRGGCARRCSPAAGWTSRAGSSRGGPTSAPQPRAMEAVRAAGCRARGSKHLAGSMGTMEGDRQKTSQLVVYFEGISLRFIHNTRKIGGGGGGEGKRHSALASWYCLRPGLLCSLPWLGREAGNSARPPSQRPEKLEQLAKRFGTGDLCLAFGAKCCALSNCPGCSLWHPGFSRSARQWHSYLAVAPWRVPRFQAWCHSGAS